MTSAEQTASLAVWVQPGASRQRLAGMMNGALKVAVSAPPEKGKANKAVERLVTSELGLPSGSVRVAAGETSRRKRLTVRGLDQSALDAILAGKGFAQ